MSDCQMCGHAMSEHAEVGICRHKINGNAYCWCRKGYADNNPPAGTPNAVRVEYPCTCSANERSGVAPPSPFCPLHGTHPVTPTPNAVEEALEAIRRRTKSWIVYDSSDEDFSEPLDSDEGYRRLITAVRTQAFAEVRRVVEETDIPDTAALKVFRALDTLQREGK